jgi:trans-aconitate methyltransferase
MATERLVWAVETLALVGNESILEIGCGHGVAISLVCAQLTTGTITAIDHSQKMIDAATKRNAAWVAAGRATFHCTTLEAVDTESGGWAATPFEKIFAIRVNFFIQQPARQLPKIKQLLAPGGTLYLFYDSPVAAQVEPFLTTATQTLHVHGFTVAQVIGQGAGSEKSVCMIAKGNQ